VKGDRLRHVIEEAYVCPLSLVRVDARGVVTLNLNGVRVIDKLPGRHCGGLLRVLVSHDVLSLGFYVWGGSALMYQVWHTLRVDATRERYANLNLEMSVC
jgi:hypothetical protein